MVWREGGKSRGREGGLEGGKCGGKEMWSGGWEV